MKKLFIKLSLPIGLGMTVTAITVIGLLSSCEKPNTCPDGYPLWCSEVKKCCPPLHAYNCDGACSTRPCPLYTVTVDTCTQ